MRIVDVSSLSKEELNAYLHANVLGPGSGFNQARMHNPSGNMSILDALRLIPFGMAYDQISIDGVTWKPALFVKMNEMEIRKLGPIPLFDFKPELIIIDNVAVVVLMMSIRGKRWICETYFNYYASDIDNRDYKGADSFIDFASHDTLTLNFVNEYSKIVRTIEVENKVKNAFKSYIDIIQALPPWSMEAFDAAKAEYISKTDLDNIWYRHFRRM